MYYSILTIKELICQIVGSIIILGHPYSTKAVVDSSTNLNSTKVNSTNKIQLKSVRLIGQFN